MVRVGRLLNLEMVSRIRVSGVYLMKFVWMCIVCFIFVFLVGLMEIFLFWCSLIMWMDKKIRMIVVVVV